MRGIKKCRIGSRFWVFFKKFSSGMLFANLHA